MYAIIKSGGKQYRVEKDSVVKVDLMDREKGSEFECNEVMLLKTAENEYKVGTPFVEGAKVNCKVMEHVKAKKLVVFKMKRRKGYRKKTGHRQKYTRLQITDIQY